jgi:hypothetical protein
MKEAAVQRELLRTIAAEHSARRSEPLAAKTSVGQ